VRYAKILLDKREVADLTAGGRSEPGEVTAYYCVSRTRMVLRHLFKQQDTEAKKQHESGGGFLLWAES
jgi:hypothetical protein